MLSLSWAVPFQQRCQYFPTIWKDVAKVRAQILESLYDLNPKNKLVF